MTFDEHGRFWVQRTLKPWIALLVLALLAISSTGIGAAQNGAAGPFQSLNITAGLAVQQVFKPTVPNLSTVLDRLATGWGAQSAEAASQARSAQLEVERGRVLVTLIMLDLSSADAAVAALPALGGEVRDRFQTWIDAWVPLAALEQVANLPGVSLVREPVRVETFEPMSDQEVVGPQVGSMLTQGVLASNAHAWHAAGITGQGVRVAVIDSFKDVAVAQGRGELPSSINVLPPLDFSSRHGTSVAEIIHDMAPGAELTLATPPSFSATSMAQYIVTLAQSGHHIISSSIGPVHAGPGDGTGIMADAMRTAALTYGTFFVQAAGNQAQFHWDGTFVDQDNDGWHEVAPGTELNLINQGRPIPAGYPIRLNLRWNAWPASSQDYDLYLLAWDGNGWVKAAESVNQQTGTQPPQEQIAVPAPAATTYAVSIHRYKASGQTVLDLNGFNVPPLQHSVAARSLIEPAVAPYAYAVAALDAGNFALESYSSQGPTYGPGGALSGGGNKPNLSGFANVQTWADAPDLFNGTSSATPHVAGAAALVRQAFPASNPPGVATFLNSRAVDQGTPAYDHIYGTGRLFLGPPPVASGPQVRMFLPHLVR